MTTDDIRALIVDDNIALRYTLVQQLDKLGVKTDSAANGIEALRRVHNHAYELIFMDIQMPEMNGLEATVAIRSFEKSNKLKHVPIIGISAGVEEHGINDARCRESGMDDFIEKPILMPTLEKIIANWMADSE